MEFKLLEYEEFEKYILDNLTDAEYKIYKVLLRYLDESQGKYISITQEKIAQESCVPVHIVRKCLKKLVKKNL